MEGSGQPGARSAYVDNVKAILIILVVFAHVFSPIVAREAPGSWLYRLILVFHMPAFAFISGWLSRREIFTRKGVRSVVWLTWAFVAMTMANHAVWVLALGWPLQPIKCLKDPYFGLWFIQALIWWRLLLFVFGAGSTRRAAWASVAAATLLALLAGYLPFSGALLSASRTFAFLPFFVAGYRVRQLGLAVSRTPKTRAVAVAVFGAAFAGVAMADGILSARPLFHNRTYSQLGDSVWADPLPRLGLLIASAVLVAAFLHLVPRRKLPITHLGATVLSVYAWHILAVRLMKAYGLTEFFAGTWATCILTTAALVVFFGFGPVARYTVRALNGARV